MRSSSERPAGRCCCCCWSSAAGASSRSAPTSASRVTAACWSPVELQTPAAADCRLVAKGSVSPPRIRGVSRFLTSDSDGHLFCIRPAKQASAESVCGHPVLVPSGRLLELGCDFCLDPSSRLLEARPAGGRASALADRLDRDFRVAERAAFSMPRLSVGFRVQHPSSAACGFGEGCAVLRLGWGRYRRVRVRRSRPVVRRRGRLRS